MSNPTFGISIEPVTTEPRPAIWSDMSVAGLVGTAPDADEDIFPLGKDVLMFSDDATMLAALGSTGTLPDAIKGINAQLGEFQVAARVVVVREQYVDGDEDATVLNIRGADGGVGNRTGIYALLDAGENHGVIPRLIACPGYTHQHTSTAGATAVTEAAKAGGNTGDGDLALADPAYGAGVKDGVYVVRCTGGTAAGTAAEQAGGNTGDGGITMASPSAESDAKLGIWRLICVDAEADGGTFTLEDPDGITVAAVSVGNAYAGDVKFTIADGATDYEVGDAFDITVVAAVPANGGVFSVVDPDGVALADATVGVAYTGVVKFTIADGATDFAIGDGFDVTVAITAGTANANPVCAALPTVLDKLLAHAVVEGPGTSLAAYTAWRETMSHKRLIPQETWCKVDGVKQPMSPRIIGIAIRRDHEYGGRPFHSWANQPVQGIDGPDRKVSYSLTDGATEGQTILSQNGGIVVRGEMGVENAIASSGFIYIGTDTCSEDSLWQFYNVTRGRDYIHLMLLRTLRFYLGRYNIDAAVVDMIYRTMDFGLRDLEADRDILGYKISFQRDQNSPEELRLGKLTIDFAAEEPPVLRWLNIRSARYRPALDALLDEIIAQIDANNA